MAKIIAKLKIYIPAGEATPAPPIGPTLAPYGINISEFCQKFNEKTKEEKGFKVPTEIVIYEDRSFKFETKTPLTSELLKKAAGIEKGAKEPKREKVGKITRKQLEEIAKIKLPDLNTDDLKKAVKIIEGTAKNMGLEIE